MTSRFGIFTPSTDFAAVKNPFGKDTANLGLFQALAEHGGFEELSVLSTTPATPAALGEGLLRGRPSPTRLRSGSIYDLQACGRAGSVLRGKADLADLAWLRRPAGDRAYSLIGLVHTLAPPALRDYVAAACLAPVQPWDALICTSPAVKDALGSMFETYGAYLADRFGGQARPGPSLPLVPLGVDGAAIAAQADRPDVRSALRDRLGVGADDLLVLWFGRLSFFEKAFPQPMLRAVAEAGARSGRRICFAMAGWFPNGDMGRQLYEEAARAYAPEVPLHILDGNDQALVSGLWAASDIFLSLVDNIQETFGLTPLEAMAAGLPVVASDWDGYRYTIRDGGEGFLARTLGGPAGPAGRMMSARHVLGQDPYQSYVGTVAQFTAVDVEQAASAIARLAGDPALRRQLGEAGRERIRTAFAWPIVAHQIRALADDLAAERVGARAFGTSDEPRVSPIKGDPFAQFAGFATSVLDPATRISLRAGIGVAAALGELRRSESVRLDGFAAEWRANRSELTAVLNRLGDREATVAQVQAAFPAPRREAIALGLVWMCKIGLLTWSDGPARSDG